MKVNWRFIQGWLDTDMGWIRLFGYGIAWKDLGKHGILFSDREGKGKRYRIGRYQFKFLRREKDAARHGLRW